MYWSRKFKIFDCKTSQPCDYIGVSRNNKRFAISYDVSGCCSTIRKHPRIRNNKEEMKLLADHGYFNDVYKNRYSVDKAAGIECNRSRLHLYRRNQPTNRAHLGQKNKYNYSYNDYLKVKKLSYKYRLPTNRPPDTTTTYEAGGYGGGNCDLSCNPNKDFTVIWKPNNKNYNVQGAVSSSSRIDRLKLETIRGAKKCANDNTICNGKYFAGKPRHYGYGKSFMFNATNKEQCNIQDKAKGRVRGTTKQMSGDNCY
jgi:hypothetical protein|tara:strand:+ start:724 stop:1488 length:765 start_codon:yes stop_codon:yes gene_type:complete